MNRLLVIPLVAILSLISCNDDDKVAAVPDRTQDLNELQLNSPQFTLINEAEELTRDWEELQLFITQLENYDHSTRITDQLITLLDSIKTTVPEKLQEQPVSSRLLVVETRLKSYRSFLDYNVKKPQIHENRYNSFITAWDNLIAQLNEKPQFDKKRQQLLDDVISDK